MPGKRTKSIKTLDWEHSFAAIFKYSSKDADPTEIVVADSSEINGNKNLQRVLRVLQYDLIHKQIYLYAKNPTTRFLTFRANHDGTANQAQPLLNDLIAAKGKKQVEAQAVKLASRYKRTPNIQTGVLIFLVAQAKYKNEEQGACVFVFKCDFEQISQVTERSIFRRIEDAIVEKTKKGMVYPYYDEGRFDDTTVRVFDELGQTQYWLDFLELGERPAKYLPLQTATLEEWARLNPEAPAKYEESIKDLKLGRSINSQDIFVEPEDRLSIQQTKALASSVTAKTGKQNITLTLDGVRITAPLAEYGQSWILAEQAGTRYLLVKGADLEMHTEMLNLIDLTSPVSVTQARKELNIP
jgi:hypothetical protein